MGLQRPQCWQVSHEALRTHYVSVALTALINGPIPTLNQSLKGSCSSVCAIILREWGEQRILDCLSYGCNYQTTTQ